MEKKFYNIFKGDKVIWMIFFFLCIVSILEVFSASSFLTYKTGSYWGPVVKHTFFILGGVAAMVCVVNVPCKYFKIATPLLLLISFVLLLVVLVIGESTNGASRWIPLGLFNFQPSEIAKGALILAVAQILSATQTENGADKSAFLYILLTSLVIIFPIFLENFSTAFLLGVVVLGMMIVGRVPMVQIGKLIGVVVLIGALAIGAIMAFGDEQRVSENKDQKQEVVQKSGQSQVDAKTAKDDASKHEKSGGLLHRMDTWKSRISKFLSGEKVAPKDYDLDKNAQVAHANIAIASSGIWGSGPGNSQERDFLSQAFSDFIYAIIIEESGLIGAAIVAALYIIIFFRAGRIAHKCENNFPAFLAMGIGMLLVVQALFNMCVAVGLAPVTGQPLPLISRGGTSTIINCIYIGVLLSISRTAKKRGSKPVIMRAKVGGGEDIFNSKVGIENNEDEN